MSKICRNCGTELNPNAKFCGSCGTVFQSAQTPPDPRSKKRFLIALCGVLAVILLAGTGIWFFTKDGTEMEIAGCYPESGSRGEFVLLEFNQAVDETELEVFYGSEAIQGSRPTDTVIAVNVPLDARSDDFVVRYKGKEAKRPFSVMQEEWVELSRETANPSSEMQSIYCADDISRKRTGTVLNERIGSKFFGYPLNTTGKKAGTYISKSELDYEYLSAVFIRYLTQQANCDFRELVKFVASTGWEVEPVAALGEFVRMKFGVNFASLYTDFVIWMLEEGNLTGADFNNPDNKDTVAEKSQSISITENRVTLVVEKQEP